MINNFKLISPILGGKIKNLRLIFFDGDFINHPLFAGSFIMIFGSNAVSFINYLYHLVMGRMLGPSNYGELAALISLMGLLGIIPGSVTLVIIKHVSSVKNEEEVSGLVIWFKKKILLFSIIYTLIILLLSPIIASFLKISNLSYLILIAVFFLFSLQSSLYRSILQGLLKFKEMISSILIENSAKLMISVLLVYLGLQVGGVMFALVISSLLGFYVTINYLKLGYKKNKGVEFTPNVKSMLVFAIPVALQSMAVTSLYSSDVILVKHFFSAHDAGIYAALSNLGKIIFFGAGPIGAVMFPLVAKRNALGQNYRQIFIYSFLTTAFLAISVLAIYWLFPQFAITLLYGKLYLGASNLLIWFGIFMSLFTLSTLLISYGLSLGKASIVILPLIAALAQIILIILFHQSLFIVIFISIIITALLLVSLLIYSTYGKRTVLRNE